MPAYERSYRRIERGTVIGDVALPGLWLDHVHRSPAVSEWPGLLGSTSYVRLLLNRILKNLLSFDGHSKDPYGKVGSPYANLDLYHDRGARGLWTGAIAK